MLKKCPICGGDIILAKKKVLISVPNPGELLIDAECEECQKCGERYFDEKQSNALAKKIDKEIKDSKGKLPLKLGSGTLIA